MHIHKYISLANGSGTTTKQVRSRTTASSRDDIDNNINNNNVRNKMRFMFYAHTNDIRVISNQTAVQFTDLWHGREFAAMQCAGSTSRLAAAGV